MPSDRVRLILIRQNKSRKIRTFSDQEEIHPVTVEVKHPDREGNHSDREEYILTGNEASGK